MSAQVLFDKLISENIIGATGESSFMLNGLSTVVLDSSIIGNLIQEWLKKFMTIHSISFRFKSNTQEFPDFLMHADNDNIELLEVKCFKGSPNFDVANFQAYARSLTINPYRLDADYLIFKYRVLASGIVIENIWLKKVWEICGGSERSALKIQWKQGMPVNIRPATWFSGRTAYPPFSTRKEFVTAIKKVLDTSSVSAAIQRGWFDTVSTTYRSQTENDL